MRDASIASITSHLAKVCSRASEQRLRLGLSIVERLEGGVVLEGLGMMRAASAREEPYPITLP